MTELLTLVPVAVVLAGGLVALGRLQRLLDRVGGAADQVQASNAACRQHVESLTKRMGSVEESSANAAQTGRAVCRQLTELNRVIVDQAVILVEVRDDLRKAKSSTSRTAPASRQEAEGRTHEWHDQSRRRRCS